MCECLHKRVCVPVASARARVCLYVCVHVHVRARVCVFVRASRVRLCEISI